MKPAALISGLATLLAAITSAEPQPPAPAEIQAKHAQGAEIVAADQDELSADVQQLIVEQTVPKVIELLTEVEDIMAETTDRLAAADTGGETMAGQTEIIEKIHAAAKEKQKQGGGSQSGGAMMDMMERMMGKKPQDGQPDKKGQGDQPGDNSGGGMNGQSDSGNDAAAGQTTGRAETRRIPKAAGNAGQEIPAEFRRALDAYNRGVEQKIK